jgi:hypothetical protein
MKTSSTMMRQSWDRTHGRVECASYAEADATAAGWYGWWTANLADIHERRLRVCYLQKCDGRGE